MSLGSAARNDRGPWAHLGSQAIIISSTSHPLALVSFGGGGSVSMCQQIDQIGGN